MINKSKIVADLKLDLSDTNLSEPFNVLVDSLNNEANLSFTGKLAAKYQIKQHLRNRHLISQFYEGIKQPKVSQPIFVIGLPRSGTTFLFNLLSQDSNHRSPLFWEMMKPFPLVKTNGYKEKLRIGQSNLILFFKERFIPQLDDLHAIKSDSPEECLLIKVFALQSILYFYMANTPTYLDYLSNCDTRIAYSQHFKFLSILERQQKPQRWLLKDPSHLGNLDEILNYYPDARFIHIIRDPVETIPSICSLTAQVRKGFSSNIDLHDIGKRTINFWEQSNKKNESQKLKFSSKEYMQVQYKDLIDDPINLMKDIYANFDFHLDDKTLTEMIGYIEKGSLEDKAKHKYSLEDYGLDEAEVHNKLNYS